MKESAYKKVMTRAFTVLLAFVIIGVGSTGYGLIDAMFVKGAKYSALAEEQQLQDIVTRAKRGDIFDRNGKVLAKSWTVWQTYVVPNKLTDEQKNLIVSGFPRFVDKTAEELKAIVDKNTGYEKIGAPVEEEAKNKISEYISENGLTSVIGLSETTKRYYPNGDLAASVLGFVGTDNQGLNGIEIEYDSILTGTEGRVIAAKTPAGEELPFTYEKVIEAQPGNSIVLTIDEYIQAVVEKHLKENVEQNGVKNRAACIVMDVNTGEILAMANEPDFDPNEPFKIKLDEEYEEEKQKIDEDETLSDEEKETEKSKLHSKYQQEQWRNKAVSDAYEPGSVFKIVTASAALEEKSLLDSDTFSCPGYINIADRRYNCSNRDGHGHQSTAQAFMNSCNPAFITIGQKLGAKNFSKYRKAFGLENKTGIDLPGEGTSIYHNGDTLTQVELASESFGQTLEITPIQLITAISAAVNGGYVYQPHVVKQVQNSEGDVIETVNPSLVRQVISEETSKMICKYLEGVVSEGTGKNAYIPGYRIGGKTGTAEKTDVVLEEGEGKRYVCSFAGIAPADKPEIAILMLIDEPSVPSPYGGTLVAPSVGKMFEEILPYLGVSPNYTDTEALSLAVSTPNVVNQTVAEATKKIESLNLEYEIIGEGSVVTAQSPSATAMIPTDGKIILYTDEDSEAKQVTVPDFTGLTVSQANYLATNSGLNIYINGNTSNSTAYSQSLEKGTKVEEGTVITVSFRQIVNVE